MLSIAFHRFPSKTFILFYRYVKMFAHANLQHNILFGKMFEYVLISDIA